MSICGAEAGERRMFCTGCGQKLPDNAVKCPKCNKVTTSLTPPSVLAASASGAPRKTAAPTSSQTAAPGRNGASKQVAAPAKKAAAPAQAARNPKPEPPQEPAVPSGPPPEPVFSPIEHDSGIGYGRALFFFFKDGDWLRKALAFNTFTLTIPVLNSFAAGYFLQLARKVSTGIDLPLPETDFKPLWKAGLMYFLSFTSITLMIGAISSVLVIFAQLPMISVLAVPLLAIFTLVSMIYFVGATTIAVIEGNPWMFFNFPVCSRIILENLVDVVIVTLAISLVSSLLCPLIITGGLAFFITCHLIGQLGRVFRTRSKFL